MGTSPPPPPKRCLAPLPQQTPSHSLCGPPLIFSLFRAALGKNMLETWPMLKRLLQATSSSLTSLRFPKLLKFQWKESYPPKLPTPINPTENSLRELFSLKERGRTVCSNSSEHCLRRLFHWVGIFYLRLVFVAYSNLAWSCLLTVEIRFVFFLAVKNRLVFSAYGSLPSRNWIWSFLLKAPPP